MARIAPGQPLVISIDHLQCGSVTSPFEEGYEQMRVLIMAPMYEPEFGAAVRRMTSLAQKLAKNGNTVYVVTGMPNYPAGKVYPGYEGKWFMREEMEGVHVVRTRYYMVPRNISKVQMMLSYLSVIPAFIYGSLRVGAVDVVFVTSPPLFNLIAALFIKWWKRAKMVMDLRDLWPDEFVAVGAAKETSLFVRSLRMLERKGYRDASLVTCTTRAIMDAVKDRGAHPEKLVFIPNGAETDFFKPMPRNSSVGEEYGFGDRFVVTYSGLMGIKYGLEMLLDVANRLKDHSDIVFFIRGNGPRRDALVSQVKNDGMKNVIFGEERDINDIPYLLSRSDICISCLLPDEYLEKIISVKLFEYLSCECPVVAAVGGESARLIRESGGGIVVTPGDSAAMAEAILKLKADPVLRKQMGVAGRQFICANYARDVVAGHMEEALHTLVPRPIEAVS